MHALLSIVLALFGLGDAPALPANPAAGTSLPLLAVGYSDCLDFFLLLDDPDVHTQIVGMADCGSFALVSVVHSASNAFAAGPSWAAIYTFPSTIFAHSIVKVRMHAEEME